MWQSTLCPNSAAHSVMRLSVATVTASIACTMPAIAGGVDGDTPGNAIEINSLPFTDSGDTSLFSDDYDAVCPFSGSTAPDVFYGYQPTKNERIRIRSCDSVFDTKTYVLDSSFTEVACNDDGCSSGGVIPFHSDLRDVPLVANSTSYIAVNGWGGDAGAHVIDVALDVRPKQPCVIQCPPGSIPEDEPCDNGRTEINPGCNGEPPYVLSPVQCGTTTCGTSWATGGVRDVDSYSLHVEEQLTVLTMSITTGFNSMFGRYPNGDPQAPSCPAAALDPFVYTSIDDCGSAQGFSFIAMTPGEYWFIVVPTMFDLLPCGASGAYGTNDYFITWECEPYCPATASCSGDANGDGIVDFDDVVVVLTNWNTPCQ